MPLFGKSYDEKFFDEIAKLFERDIEKRAKEAYLKYERMRQTWQKEDDSTGLYYKVKKGEYITEQDVEKAKREATEQEVAQNDNVYTFYVDLLERLKKLGEEIQGKVPAEAGANADLNKVINIIGISKSNLKDDMEEFKKVFSEVKDAARNDRNIKIDMYTLNELGIQKLEDSFKKYVSFLGSVRQLIKNQSGSQNDKSVLSNYKEQLDAKKEISTIVKTLTNFFYGPRNFYKIKAQEFIKLYKPLFDLALKCDEKRYKKMLGKKKLDDQTKISHFTIISQLAGCVNDAYGSNCRLYKELQVLLECYK